MKKFVLLLVMGASLSAIAQRPTTPTTPTSPGTGTTGTGTTGTSRTTTGPKPYKEVITDKAITTKGLFTVHKVEDKYYFEIPDSIMYREIMAVTRFVKVPANSGVGRATYGGELTNRQTLSFEKGPSNNVFMRVITLINVADSTNQISKAVSNSNLNPIAAAFAIAALGKDSTSVVIDVTEFFKGDNQVVSLNPAGKRSFNLAGIASDRSYIQHIHTYPINTEIRTVKTFTSMPSAGPAAPGTSSVPAANAAGAVTFELNTSMMLLPRTPMAKRHWDRRVGYFPDQFVSYTDDQQKVDEETFAVRWRLEPKDADIERWKRGELVEPKKQIIYYIDPATPKKWVPYLIQGINDWQVAFEAAGFKNAIVGKEWPNDPTMSTEDARFSVLRYFASDVTNAYGPNVHDPRSGEILESHIGWYHNVMKLLHDWYMIQAAAVNPRARSMKFDDDLMGQLIRFVSSHEVGHTIGLLHNMGSSSRTPVDSLRNKRWVEENGHTASIMDYARFNYVAQPEDNINEKGLFPKIGEYDIWAIKWGYGYIPGNTEEERKKNSDKLIRETIARNPRTWFGTYELGNDNDPRSQREDLSDNSVKASEYGIKNLQRILVNLQEWTKEPNQINENLTEMYGQLVGQFNRYMGHVTTNVGGVHETFRTADEGGAIYEVVSRNRQKEAVNFLHNQLFETPKWLIDRNIWNRISNPGEGSDPVSGVQTNGLNSLLSNDRLNRLQVNVERFGAANAYSAIELLNDVQTGVFSELKSKKAIDMYRRGLQKTFVERLNSILNPAPAGLTVSFGGASSLNVARTDLPAIARAQLLKLKAQVAAAIPTTTDSMSKIHLQDLQERINRALDPNK
jgi:hypothetical protein